MRAGEKIGVVLCDDHASLREGLRLLLAVDGDIAILGEAESGEAAVEATLRLAPDVVLMDVGLAGLDGIEATRQVHQANPAQAVIMLSAKPELRVVRAALNAGALGYMIKRAGGDELRSGVRAAAAGQPFFSREVMAVARERSWAVRGRPLAPEPNPEDPASLLTLRELEILQLVAGGNSNREIGDLLDVSPKTIDAHRANLMAKLEVHDITGLTRYAIRKGLIE